MTIVYNHWAKAGGIAAVFIIGFSLLKPGNIFTVQTAAWLNFAFLMLHQFEEYVFPGGFMEFFRNRMQNKIKLMKFGINDKSAFHVNVTLGWSVYLICALFGYKYPATVVILLGITLINGLVHSGALLKFKSYNPGFITGLFIFIPLPVYTIIHFIQTGVINPADLPLIFTGSVLGTLIIPLTLFIFRETKNDT